jgi:DNA-binding CsgD family transcriptional regulator
VLGEFSHSIASCTTPADVGLVFAREVAQHGYTASACRAIDFSDAGAQSRFYFRDCPPSWAKVADACNLGGNSLLLAHARHSTAAFCWSDAMAGRTLTRAQREVFDAAYCWGWVNGFVVPVHGPNGYLACVGMDSPEPDLDFSPQQRLRLRLAALLAHERCCELASDERARANDDALTERERECLEWVAAGKTDWEIGRILSISANTVKFHVSGARDKLGARSRAQAVARFMLNGRE